MHSMLIVVIEYFWVNITETGVESGRSHGRTVIKFGVIADVEGLKSGFLFFL
jgi:hypothetical protein